MVVFWNIPFEKSLLLIALALFAGAIIAGIINRLVKKKFSFIWVKGFHLNIKHLLDPLTVLLPPLCISLISPFLDLPARAQPFLGHGVQLWIIASIGWAIKRFVVLMRGGILHRYNISAADNLHARRMYTQIRLIEQVINFMILIVTLSFMVMSFSEAREVGISIFASAGVVSVIIGFAAQKSLGNVLAGIQLAVSQPIRLEDAVVVEGEWGWVEEITLTYVVIRIWDLRRLIVPISYFIEKPFENWTRTSADLIGTVFLYTDYTVPVEEVRQELTCILEKSMNWDKKVNVLQVTDIKEQTVELRAIMSAADSSIAWNLRCEVREKLLEFLQKKYPLALPRSRIDITAKKQGGDHSL
jgi:small-conductance mechanosensitive channel